MAYDRWGMTEGDATALTGADPALTEADLEAAEEDLVELVRARPNPDAYSTAVDVHGFLVDRRVETFGKAVAWQAAHRAGRTASPDDQPVVVTSEGVAEWQAAYRGGRRDDPAISSRARRLLASGGWLAQGRTGITLP